MADIQLVMAARARVLFGNNHTLAGALLDKKDSDLAVLFLEEAYGHRGSNQPWDVLSILELMLAGRVDNGEKLPISSQEGYAAARWLAASVDPANPDKYHNLPSPVPRSFALYLAAAWCQNDHFDSVAEALQVLLTTKQFIAA